MPGTVAVVDDEPDILELISLHLEKAGFSVRKFTTAGGLFNYLVTSKPDLIILDLMLPDEDGVEVCRRLKSDNAYSSIPVIMVTARVSETDKVLGLELGADDYITKPFSPRELVARVKAVLRRYTTRERSVINVGGILRIDPSKYEVFVGKTKVDLTPTEFKILYALASRRGWVFSREKLLSVVHGDNRVVIDRTIDVHIRNIRKKLGTAGKFIKNVRGVGYKLEE